MPLAQLMEVYVDCGHRPRFSYGELRSGNDAGLPIKSSIGPLLQQRRFAAARATASVQPVRAHQGFVIAFPGEGPLLIRYSHWAHNRIDGFRARELTMLLENFPERGHELVKLLDVRQGYDLPSTCPVSTT